MKAIIEFYDNGGYEITAENREDLIIASKRMADILKKERIFYREEIINNIGKIISEILK